MNANGRSISSIPALTASTVRVMLTRPPTFNRIVSEVYQSANRSLGFVSLTLAFFGMILVYQGCMQAMRIYPDLSSAGAIVIKTMVRVFGPLLTGLMVAFRVGAGIAAEAGTMVVTDQADALTVSGSTTTRWLVAPRFAACIIGVPLLTTIGIGASVLAGGAFAWARFDILPATFFRIYMVEWEDVVICFIKSFLNGATIPIVAGAAGLATRNSSEGVGIATTNAVVNSAVAVVIIEFLVSFIASVTGH